MKKEDSLHRKQTEDRRAVRAIDTEEIYRMLVTEVRDYAIFMLDPGGTILTWNIGAERLKGYTANEIIGSHFSRFYRAADIEAGRPDRTLAVALADGRSEEEGWRVRKDGSLFWADVVVTALYDENGIHRGFAKVTRDLTERRTAEETLREQARTLQAEVAERRQAEAELLAIHVELERRVEERTKELAKANSELGEASRMKDDFLATLSHELRTPLTSAFGWLQLLLAGTLDPNMTQKGLQIVDRNLRAQIRLVDDLLNVSNIVAGKLHLDLLMVDVVSVVSTAVDSIRPTAKQKGVELRFLTPSSTGSIFALADRARLEQIVWNLLSNAVKFTPKGGRVQLVLERIEDSLVVRISDTGEGIIPEFLPHVFERFRQADSSMSRKQGGLGIGLAVVRQLVELHGGIVKVESAGKGKGATFTVLLPIQHFAATGMGRTTQSAPGPMGERLVGIRIVVVEDDPDAKDLICTVLKTSGADYLVFSSVSSALPELEKNLPDVLIADIGLPDRDGYSLISAIRALDGQQGRVTPALAITAYSSTADCASALEAGYTAHMSKPFEPEELVATLAELASRR